MHPLQNLICGGPARAMLIQIQKLKLVLEIIMLELDQILKANEISFAVLAALPIFLYITHSAIPSKDMGASGQRGRR